MRKNPVEWVILAASIGALLVVTGILLAEALGGETPADPVVTLREGEAVSGADGWLLPATITNNGGDEAASLTVEATADVAGMTEVSAVTVDYLAGGSSVEVTFGFSDRPAGQVEVRVVSFSE